jgi:riboflavin kinase / FMN adenylyltransferase
MRQFDALDRVVLPGTPVHLAIGIFDGVHRGHRKVIGSALAGARADGGLAGVLTFWPHPATVLRPEPATPLVLTREHKRSLLERLGIDFFVEHPFTPEFATTSARSFVTQLKRALPQLRQVYVGENFRFGREREGDVAAFTAAAREEDFVVRAEPRLQDGGETISSSRLRALLAEGEVEAAQRLLGYTYHVVGRVEQGRQLGRTLGFPTLNVRWVPNLRPRYGVYAVRVGARADTAVPAVANFGVRPTVDGTTGEPQLEVHVLGNTALHYGDTITVWWLKFLRPEIRFSGLDALRAQVEIDREQAGREAATIHAQEFPNSA